MLGWGPGASKPILSCDLGTGAVQLLAQHPFTQGGTEAKQSPGAGQSSCAGRPHSLGPGTLSMPGWWVPPLPTPGRPPGARPTLSAAGGGISSVQSLSHVRLFATPWTAACQAALSIRE